jgi:hypothetical protein
VIKNADGKIISRSKLTKAEAKAVRDLERNYTKAVNDLAQHPDRSSGPLSAEGGGGTVQKT